MGFLDFLKDVGTNLFGGGDEAEELTAMLNKELPGKITDLKVEFNEGTVTLTGAAESLAIKEKAVLLAGNIKGVEKVNDDALTAERDAFNECFWTEDAKAGILAFIAKESAEFVGR